MGHIERKFRNEILSSQLNVECLFAGLKGVKTFPPKLNWCKMLADSPETNFFNFAKGSILIFLLQFDIHILKNGFQRSY